MTCIPRRRDTSGIASSLLCSSSWCCVSRTRNFNRKSQLPAAMVRVLEKALEFMGGLEAGPPATPLAKLKAVTRWTMQVQLAGEMPSLPAQNSALRNALAAHKVYLDRLMEVSEQLGTWIEAAQREGQLSAELPPELVLYTLFARACDPVLGVLKAGGQYSDEQIVELLLTTCFKGLGER